MNIRASVAIAAYVFFAACSTYPELTGKERLTERASPQPADESTISAEPGHILNCQEGLGHHLAEREYVCPIGGEKFSSLTLGTHSTYGRHLDWEPVSYMEFPAPMPVCPSNGFVIYKEEFSEDELDLLKEAINSPEYIEEFNDRNASYYLFGRLLELAGNPEDYELWWIFLNSTWEADQCKSTKYSRYALTTIDYAQRALSQYGKNESVFWVLNIIIPNLYRRIGEFEQAKSFLDELGENRPSNEIESSDFYSLAFELLEQAIERRDISQIAIQPPDENSAEDE